MSINFLEQIHNSNFFDIIKKDDAIVINLKQDNNVLISSWLNGGLLKNIKSVVNQSIGGNDYEDMLNGDYASFQSLKFKKLGLNPNNTAGLMTSACMDNYAISTKKYERLEVTTIATAGADKNGVKAGDTASFYEYNNNYFTHFGTINIFTIINANLHDGALVTASITATEAKTSVLQDLKIESQYSNHISTGTGTDGICIISNKNSENHLENAGKHSKLGELIAKTVQEAVRESLFLQTFMCVEYQSTVLSRLSRFNISFDDFYENSSHDDEIGYAAVFYDFNRDNRNVSFVSSVLNLIDEVQLDMLTVADVEAVYKELIFSHLDIDVKEEKIENVGDMLEILVDSINRYLFD
ncbi:MAG: hypothetical protein BZ138_01340 [Methanosphaera sp. rholeuAM270]|nr:MAG: hypothetical protein BZ138_01340 [Methanosphaera sp. rholeuAM270]